MSSRPKTIFPKKRFGKNGYFCSLKTRTPPKRCAGAHVTIYSSVLYCGIGPEKALHCHGWGGGAGMGGGYVSVTMETHVPARPEGTPPPPPGSSVVCRRTDSVGGGGDTDVWEQVDLLMCRTTQQATEQALGPRPQ